MEKKPDNYLAIWLIESWIKLIEKYSLSCKRIKKNQDFRKDENVGKTQFVFTCLLMFLVNQLFLNLINL